MTKDCSELPERFGTRGTASHPNSRGRRICLGGKVGARGASRRCLPRARKSHPNSAPGSQQLSRHQLHSPCCHL